MSTMSKTSNKSIWNGGFVHQICVVFLWIRLYCKWPILIIGQMTPQHKKTTRFFHCRHQTVRFFLCNLNEISPSNPGSLGINQLPQLARSNRSGIMLVWQSCSLASDQQTHTNSILLQVRRLHLVVKFCATAFYSFWQIDLSSQALYIFN